MTSSPKSLPLVWGFDGCGTWESASRVMDPDMVDEPIDTWNKDWCLKWRISVTEEGLFTAVDTDQYLVDEIGDLAHKRSFEKLSQLQAHIDLAEDRIRCASSLDFVDGEYIPVTLLPADKYAK